MEPTNAAAQRDEQIAEYLKRVTAALNEVDEAMPDAPMFVETFGVSIGPWDTVFYTLHGDESVYKRIDQTMRVLTDEQCRAVDALDLIDAECWFETGPKFTCTEADVLADLFTQLGKPSIADVFLRGHAHGDDDIDDRHKACRYCGKLIEPTDDLPPLARQSSWQHADGTGTGATELTRAMWCTTRDGGGYAPVQPEHDVDELAERRGE